MLIRDIVLDPTIKSFAALLERVKSLLYKVVAKSMVKITGQYMTVENSGHT